MGIHSLFKAPYSNKMKLSLLLAICFLGFVSSAWININDELSRPSLERRRFRRGADSDESEESNSDEDTEEDCDDEDNECNEDASSCKTQTKQENRRYMGTKTGYRRTVAENQHINDSWTPTGCSPLHVWTLIRHGSRYSGDDSIQMMIDELPQLRDKILASNNKLCSVDQELLKYWAVDPDLTSDLDKNLHPEGELEMELMGQRYGQRFPKLLGEYEDSKFRMRATYKLRAQQSGEFFINGLWSEDVASEAKIEVLDGGDPLIKFYDFCTAWEEQVDNNDSAKIEVQYFKESETMKSVKLSLSSLLGVNITMDDMELMHDMCRFDLMWTPNKISPWCRVFSDDELEIIEYAKDLKSYWEDGPGYNLNYDQACVLGKDMWDIFNNVINGDDSTTGTLYFSHSGATQKFLAFLQECGEEDYKIGLFLNEQLVQVPGCNEDWCPMETFIDLYPQIKGCDFNKACGIDNPSMDYVYET